MICNYHDTDKVRIWVIIQNSRYMLAY